MMTTAPEIPDRPMVVVVAEDEAVVRLSAVELLRDQGFVTIEAAHAKAALKICELQAAEIDILFTDIDMPGPMNGLELAHRVREQWPWISIIIVSGNFFVHVAELPAAGRFLPKPYDMLHVANLIHEMRRG